MDGIMLQEILSFRILPRSQILLESPQVKERKLSDAFLDRRIDICVCVRNSVPGNLIN